MTLESVPDPAPKTDTAALALDPYTLRRRRRAATRRVFLRLCGGVLGVGAVPLAQARCVEPYAVETTRHEVYLPHLPAALDGLTVAHLTDLHRGPITPDRVIEEAVRITHALAPDMVVLTGDFVHADPADAAPLVRLLAPLAPRLGIWGCLGNHDYHNGPDAVAHEIERASAGKIILLRNAQAQAAPGLWIAGIEDTLRGRPDTANAIATIPPDSAALFLTHNPVGVWGVAAHPWLALSGHTHGGQILLPGLPPPMPPGMDGFPLVAGWGTFGQARLYVSRGIGMGMAPLRFRCRPEVALHILRRGTHPPRPVPSLTGRALRHANRQPGAG